MLNAVSSGSETEETVYTYDANGNQITKATSEKTETYAYDGLNQLIGFTDGDIAASYAYNVSGLRIEKTVDGETINHVWDGSKQIVADIVDNDFYEADCYLRGTNLVAKYNYCNGVKSEYTYYTQNAHGDVVNLTDETGAVTKSYTYDAFGVEQNIDNSDTNAFRYCGEYFDAETGTVYLRARYYDPSIGRFISRDSYAGKNEDPLSLNLYTYCANNPIVFVDPSGHFPVKGMKDIIKKIKHVSSRKNCITHSTLKNNRSNNVIGMNSSGAISYDRFYFSKKRTERRNSALRDYTDEEISKNARDKSLSPKERQPFVTEEKVRGLRNKQKRKSNFQLPDPYGIDNYVLIDFTTEAEINARKQRVNDGYLMVAGGAILLVWLIANDTTGLGAADDALVPEVLYGIGKGYEMIAGN